MVRNERQMVSLNLPFSSRALFWMASWQVGRLVGSNVCAFVWNDTYHIHGLCNSSTHHSIVYTVCVLTSIYIFLYHHESLRCGIAPRRALPPLY